MSRYISFSRSAQNSAASLPSSKTKFQSLNSIWKMKDWADLNRGCVDVLKYVCEHTYTHTYIYQETKETTESQEVWWNITNSWNWHFTLIYSLPMTMQSYLHFDSSLLTPCAFLFLILFKSTTYPYNTSTLIHLSTNFPSKNWKRNCRNPSQSPPTNYPKRFHRVRCTSLYL